MLLLPALFASDGGIERILRLYLRAVGELTPPGARVHALVLNDAAITTPQLAPYATPALAAPLACGRNRLAFLWHTLRLARRSGRILCGHVHLLRVAHLARRLASTHPRPEIWLVAHGIEVWRDFTAGERRALVATDRVLCVSDFTRRQLLARCPRLDPSRLSVQPNALDPQFAAPSAADAATEPGLILAIARLSSAERYKGIDHLIRALPTIRETLPAARLCVVGDGDDRPRLENLAAESGVAAHVRFTGRATDEELRGHLARCALFALPSRGEGFGLVYLEALAHGKPCLAADAGGAPEVVDPTCGALVPFGDVAAIASACVAALGKNWNRHTLRLRAAQFSYEVFKARLAGLWTLSP